MSDLSRTNPEPRITQRAGDAGDQGGQAFVLLVAGMLAIVVGAVALGWLASGLASASARQRAADLAALAAARVLLDTGQGGLARPDLSRARRVARETARRNGAREVEVRFPGRSLADRVTVVVRDTIEVAGAGSVGGSAIAEAAVTGGASAQLADGEYGGPLAHRQGKPMRPDVALAYDRMELAARRAGHRLIVASGYRSSAEQARLFAANPDPKWVARPGRSLHRLGTELDLGPPGAYAWLAANAPRFGFVKRYSWESWHFGFGRSPGSASVGFSPSSSRSAASPSERAGHIGSGSSPSAITGALPAWVPAAHASALRQSAQRWGVGAALLAAQLQQESGFSPRAISRAGARGIAQFMPATARQYGLRDPFDPASAIDAQARMMRDLLRRFGSVPLALAAYNAGPGRVAACWCVPPITETQNYVRRIVALSRGGAPAADGAGALVRLVR